MSVVFLSQEIWLIFKTISELLLLKYRIQILENIQRLVLDNIISLKLVEFLIYILFSFTT